MLRWMALALSLLLATGAAAEETVRVKEVVVTALRAEEEVEKLPANVTVITEEDIKNSTATTVQDLLREEEGLVVRDLYGNNAKSAVDMRGFNRGVNTAILVDGRKVNEIDLSAVDWNLIPLENVERIEIVRGGGGSVLYGDHAMSGVINIITKKGRTAKPEFEADARLASYDGNTEYATLRGAAGRVSYSLFAKHSETDGYRENSEFRANDLSANLTVDITDNFYAGLRARYHDDHIGLPGGLTEAELLANRRQSVHPDDKVDYDKYGVGVDFGFSPADWAEVNLELNFNNREYDDMLVGLFFGSPYSSSTTRDTDTNEAKLKVTSRRDVLGHKNLLVAGIDRTESDVDNVNAFDFFGVSITNTVLAKREVGIYVEDEFFVNEKLSVTLGYRYTDAEYEDVVTGAFPGSGSQGFAQRAWRSGVTYNYAKGAKVFFNYSRSFRLPTTDELFDFQGQVNLLRPEEADTYEVGVVQPLGDALEARLTVFHMDIENELFLNPQGGGGFGANENADKTIRQGAEVGLNADIGQRVSVDGSYTYTKAEFDSGPFDGKTFPVVPEHAASLGANVKVTEAARLSANAIWVGERHVENDLDNSLDKLSSYTRVDARFAYRIKNFEAYVGVNNIFDKEYNEYAVVGSSGNMGFYPAPGRNYYGGVKAIF